jgi:hypothetical protein
MSLDTYRERIQNQHDWTNRALDNRCREKVSLDDFTKTPLRDVAPSYRPQHVAYAKHRHHVAQGQSSLCLPTSTAGIIRYVFGAYGDPSSLGGAV